MTSMAAAAGTLAGSTGTGRPRACPAALVPREWRDAGQYRATTPSAYRSHAGFPRIPAARSGEVPRRAKIMISVPVTARADRVRDAEVGDLHHVARGEQQVAGLDVAVHEARRVRGVQAGGGLTHDAHAPRRVQRPAGQHLGQRRPGHKLHDHERRVPGAGLAVVVDPRDVLVRENPACRASARNRSRACMSWAYPGCSILTATGRRRRSARARPR